MMVTYTEGLCGYPRLMEMAEVFRGAYAVPLGRM